MKKNMSRLNKDYYLVEEVDKVIVEKDKEIERQNKVILDMMVQFWQQVEEMSKELADWKERWKNLYNYGNSLCLISEDKEEEK